MLPEIVNEYPLINFGLHSLDTTWRLLHFIDPTILAMLPLEDEQIYQFADMIDWDILSTKKLSGPIFETFAHKINWPVFIQNGHSKEIRFLIQIKHKLKEHSDIFFKDSVKRQYYNKAFMYAFPKLIDWDWAVKNIYIHDDVLLDNWHKLSSIDICKNQKITLVMVKNKADYINFDIIANRLLTDDIIDFIKDTVNWDIICKCQTLTNDQLFKYERYLNYYIVSRYQDLSAEFIDAYWTRLDFDVISMFQNLLLPTIRKYEKKINFELLSKNSNFNQVNKIQVIKSSDSWYIIEPPIIGDVPKTNYITLNCSGDYGMLSGV